MRDLAHAPNVKRYLLVFGALMVLTVVTVLVSYWHLPIAAAVAVGLAIATLKAGLVAAFFMHLKGERILIYGLLGVTIYFLIFLFGMPIWDSKYLSARRIAEVPAAHDTTDRAIGRGSAASEGRQEAADRAIGRGSAASKVGKEEAPAHH